MHEEGRFLFRGRPENDFPHATAVHAGIQLLFAYQNTMEKERSSYWWDHVVNSTFSAHDWLEKFRMSQATFLYVCNEIRPVIKKEDTVMRTAIPVEQRVA